MHPGADIGLLRGPQSRADKYTVSPKHEGRRQPAPVADAPDRLILRVQVATGLELDAFGDAVPLDPEAWDARRRRLEESGAEPETSAAVAPP